MSAVETEGSPAEAMMWLELEAENLSARREDIEQQIKERLSSIIVSVQDYPEYAKTNERCAKNFKALSEPPALNQSDQTSTQTLFTGSLKSTLLFLEQDSFRRRIGCGRFRYRKICG